jgi:hypothetical protein
MRPGSAEGPIVDTHMAARPRLCPVQPDRCQCVCRGRAQSRAARFVRRSCDQREHFRRRTFTAKESAAPLDGPPALIGAGDRVTASNHILREAGPVAPGAEQSPAHSPLRTRWSRSPSPTHTSPALCVHNSRSDCAGSSRAWRAEGAPLKPLKKVVTGIHRAHSSRTFVAHIRRAQDCTVRKCAKMFRWHLSNPRERAGVS